jgi:hypothetical protein
MSETRAANPDDQQYFDFLDELRASGETNMFGAGPYLRDEFPELTKAESYKIMKRWQNSFGGGSRKIGED